MGEREESIHWLCYNGEKEKVCKAISNGEKINKIDKYGYCPIHYTIIQNNKELFEILCEHGCKSNETSLKLSCLHIAVYFDKFDFVEKLIDQKNCIDINGETPLMYAARFHRNDFLIYLLKKGTNLKTINPNGNTALHEAVLSGNVIGAAELIRYGAKITDTNKSIKTPFSSIQFKINKKNIKSNIKIIYNPTVSPANEKLFKAVNTDMKIKSKNGKTFDVHKCVVSQFHLPNNLSDGAMEIFIEWMYLQRSPLLESQPIDSIAKEVVELLNNEEIKSYIATYIIEQKGPYPKELLKAISNLELRNKNVNLSRYIIMKTFEKFDQNKTALKQLTNEELASLIEALPLKETLLEITSPIPLQYNEEIKLSSDHDKKEYPMTDFNKKLCQEFITWISNNQKIAAFMFPVDEERDGAIGYYKIIKKPMCIENIKTKLSDNKYKTANDFMHDLRQIWKNGMTYNRVGTLYYIYADDLRVLCEGYWDKIPLRSKDEKAMIKELQKERIIEKEKQENNEKRKLKRKVEELPLVLEDDEDIPLTVKQQPKTKTKKIKKEKLEIKTYSLNDKIRVMEKIEKLTPDQQKEIPNILGAKEIGESFELNLETMSDTNLTKLEAFCDSNINCN
ncbi:ankyrin repeat-containing protein, putative [Entamoeba dispar SAW760]|uniref:Ankyrin repeat-containing protein, putative n=1 Tax=Entamoeba dispar (strain ATCC PRA-260 / SAW760) TaxID=370354 RepID=B0EQM4_ENTDS|nr:ankyrin repeat-containing protein, putative [Entamoeba dispar SAW760]EDR23143.1 ankyrin repeat-containing protein, putative [Entamoeba dispar SAW760]|eukprot:EDR23143.1 ankyrin repeat-containing protein, putative [Entamoeba dispar SAW760]